MIRVVGCKKDGILTLMLRGHAGFAPKGNDIVCAAVSALTYALSATLTLLEEPGLKTDLKPGNTRISCRSDSTLVGSLFYQTLIGLILLEKEYPHHIEVRTAGFFRAGDEQEEIA